MTGKGQTGMAREQQAACLCRVRRGRQEAAKLDADIGDNLKELGYGG